jgi:hypothetical protein
MLIPLFSLLVLLLMEDGGEDDDDEELPSFVSSLSLVEECVTVTVIDLVG